MADTIIVNEWLQKANNDFCFAEANLNNKNEFFEQICFHFQQAAEKYLKAYIISNNLTFNKVHDLIHLLKTCTAQESTFSQLKEDCITLNAAYIETRYPVHWPTNYNHETANQAYTAAKRIAEMVLDQLKRQ